VTLTVLNFESWCSVTVNGGAASTAASITASVPAGTVTIVATPKDASFAIRPDPWFGVTDNDGGAANGTDVGSGTTETSTETVVVSAAHCVSVCCGFVGDGGTGCPATNPCP